MGDLVSPAAPAIFFRLYQLSFEFPRTVFADRKPAPFKSLILGKVHSRLVLVTNFATFLASAPKAPHGAPLAFAALA